MNVLICGDSFSADWSVKYPNAQGWPNLLSKDVNVTNLSNAGSSEYRIWKNLQTQDLKKYDAIIISHTSPYRLYVKTHPIHKNEKLHRHSDFIYNDVVEHNIKIVSEYIEQYYDLEYAIDIHQLLILKMLDICKDHRCFHIKHMNINHPPDVKIIDFSDVWKENKGIINHYSDNGNIIVYKCLQNLLNFT